MRIFLLLTLFSVSAYSLETMGINYNKSIAKKVKSFHSSIKNKDFKFGIKNKSFSAELRFKNQSYPIKFKYHGDLNKHWRDVVKASYAIKLKNKKAIDGVNEFRLIMADDKYDYWEIFGQQLSKQLGLVSRKISLVNLIINGQSVGQYHFYEDLSPDAIEHNGLRGAFVIRENNVWLSNISRPHSIYQNTFMAKNVTRSDLQFYPGIYRIRPKKNAGQALKRWKKCLELVKNNKSDCFDKEKIYSFLTIVALFGSYHSLLGDNLKWVYRPWSGKFEPVYYDTIPAKLHNDLDGFLGSIGRHNKILKNIISTQDLKNIKSAIRSLSKSVESEFESFRYAEKIKSNYSIIQKW